MSDLKNVLKAGFLVTASLLATGCGDDNKTTTPAPAPAPAPAPGTGGSNPSVISTFTPDIGKAMTSLRTSFPGTELPVPAEGYRQNYDVFKNLKPVVGSSTAVSSGTNAVNSAVRPQSLVDLTSLKMKGDESLLFDVSNTNHFKPTENHIGALFFDGAIDSNTRHVAHGKVKGHLRVPAVALRNAVLTGGHPKTNGSPQHGTFNDSIAAQYAFVAVDAAIGYDSARANNKGEKMELPINVHSMPASLSAGTAKAAAGKKATHTTKITHPQKAKTKANPKVTTPPIKASVGGPLVLRSLKLGSEEWVTRLNNAGLRVHDQETGQFDIAGRIADIEAENVIIAGVSDGMPELIIPAEMADAGGGTHQNDPVVKTPRSKSFALSAGKAAKSKATVTAKRIDAKTHKKAPTAHTLVKKDGTHHFLFAVKEGGLFPEVGKLVVNANTDLQAIAHYTLTVHDLELKSDLGVRVLAEPHTFEKLEDVSNLAGFDTSGNTAANKRTHGQEMMKLLAEKDHEVHESDILEESDTVTKYQHYNENVPFALYVTHSVANTGGHKLVLSAVDLDKDVNLTAGVYVLPLVKDFTGHLPNNEGSKQMALGTHDDQKHETLVVKEWKIMSNGYHDLVLAIHVENKAPSNALGAGTIEHALMSSEVQDRRSVEVPRLNAVVERLNPTNLIEASFANVSTSRINQVAQFASLARGVNVATAEKMGDVEHYTASFNHNGTQVGFTYSLDGGDAFTGNKGATSFGANVASNLLGLTAIVSADACVDAAKNPLASASHASYNAGLTLAKAYSLSGLSVVPMAGFGVASNAINGYSAVVPMAAGSLGLHMNNVSFTSATFHAGVNVALDEFVAATAGVNTSLAFGVAGYLAATADATLSTSEGKSADLRFGGSSSVVPYAQFNLGFASGEKVNALISTGVAAVNFGIDR